MAINAPFLPAYTQNQTVAVTVASAAIVIDQNAKAVRVVNPNDFIVFVRISAAPIAATPKDFVVLPHSASVITKPDGHSNVSVIADTGGAGNVYVMPGEGFESTAA